MIGIQSLSECYYESKIGGHCVTKTNEDALQIAFSGHLVPSFHDLYMIRYKLLGTSLYNKI